jgi:hypothetical protein
MALRNRQVRVVRLATRRGPWRRFPGGDGSVREPHGQTAPLPQRLIILLRHAPLRPRNMVAALYLCGMTARSGAAKNRLAPLRHVSHPCNTLPPVQIIILSVQVIIIKEALSTRCSHLVQRLQLTGGVKSVGAFVRRFSQKGAPQATYR